MCPWDVQLDGFISFSPRLFKFFRLFLCARKGRNAKWWGLIRSLVIVSPFDATVHAWFYSHHLGLILKVLRCQRAPYIAMYCGPHFFLFCIYSQAVEIREMILMWSQKWTRLAGRSSFLWEKIQRVYFQDSLNYWAKGEKKMLNLLKVRQERKRQQ